MQIFLDLDGVLADFVSAACFLHNQDPSELNWGGNDDICKALGVSQKEFWSRMDEDPFIFWTFLRRYPWAMALVSEVERFDPEWHIVTSPPLHPMAAAGKIAWIYRNIQEHTRRFFLTPQKQLLAGPGRVLIDDRDKEINRWKAAGGFGILFPQPWNSEADFPDKARIPLVRDLLTVYTSHLGTV